MCLDSNESEGFMTTSNPILFINLKNKIILHTEIYESVGIKGTNKQKQINLDQNYPLFVGQQITMYIISIQQDKTISIKNAQIYQNYLMKPLKSWMVFSSDTNTLSLTLSKEALNQDKQGNNIESTQTIIFQVHQPLDDSSFINSSLQINANYSKLIAKALQDSGVLDEVLMVNVNFGPYSSLNIALENIFDPLTYPLNPDQKDKLFSFIRYVLQHSIVLYPIDFKVEPSLSFHLTSLTKDYVFSYTGQVIMYIKLKQKGTGRFVLKNYPGVLFLLSQQQDEIKLEGETIKINQILQQGIKFDFQEDDINYIQFNVQIEDGINYGISQDIPYQEASFIKKLSKVVFKDDDISLQEDFSSKIQDSSIYINERFQYTISQDMFIGDRDATLNFNAKIKDSNGEYIDIPLNHWLQFSKNDRLFSGLPSQKEFRSRLYIELNVTDNYSYVTQTFYIDVNKLPAIYIIQILVQILGPLLGLIGIWKYKYILYNIIYKKNYTYSKDIVNYGQPYAKQILLNYNNLIEAENMLKYFLTLVSNKDIQKQIYYMYSLSNFTQNEDTIGNSKKNILVYQRSNTESLHLSQPLAKKQSTAAESQEMQQKMNKLTNKNLFTDDEILKNSPKNLDYNLKELNKISDNKIPLQNFSFKLLNEKNNQNLNLGKLQFTDRKQDENIFEECSSYHLHKCNYEKSFSNKDLILLKEDQNQNQNGMLNSVQLVKNEIGARQNRVQSQFKKQINSKLQSQITKISKYSSNLEKSSKVNTQSQRGEQLKYIDIQFKFQLFDEQGRINYDSIVEYILKENMVDSTLSDYHINQLKQKQSLLRKTFEGFLAEYILQQDQFSYNLFSFLFKNSQTTKNKIPDWYKQYCSFEPNIDDIQSNPIPKIIFKDNEIEKVIKYYIFGFNNSLNESKNLDQIPFSMNLLKETIKAYALGFISQRAKLKSQSSGESIKTQIHRIKQITSFQCRNEINKNPKYGKQSKFNLLKNLKNKLSAKLIEKPLIDNSKLPSWIKSVDIINSNLLIIGQPEKKDLGSYHIRIFSEGNFILRSFEIKVIDHHIVKQVNNLKLQQKENNSHISQTLYGGQTISQRYFEKKSSQVQNQFTPQQDFIIEEKTLTSQFPDLCEKLSYMDGNRIPHQNQFID